VGIVAELEATSSEVLLDSVICSLAV